ncbi:hypothetical protein CAPTEDRAFT_93947, partial [Capitella teleta]
VLHHLSKLKKTKSPGPGVIHRRILIEIKEIIAKPLSVKYQHSLDRGQLPDT